MCPLNHRNGVHLRSSPTTSRSTNILVPAPRSVIPKHTDRDLFLGRMKRCPEPKGTKNNEGNWGGVWGGWYGGRSDEGKRKALWFYRPSNTSGNPAFVHRNQPEEVVTINIHNRLNLTKGFSVNKKVSLASLTYFLINQMAINWDIKW